MEELKALDKNIKSEYSKIDGVKDQKLVDGFYKKVAFLKKEVPIMQGIWYKLGLDQNEAEPIFKNITKKLNSYQDKEDVEMKKKAES